MGWRLRPSRHSCTFSSMSSYTSSLAIVITCSTNQDPTSCTNRLGNLKTIPFWVTFHTMQSTKYQIGEPVRRCKWLNCEKQSLEWKYALEISICLERQVFQLFYHSKVTIIVVKWNTPHCSPVFMYLWLSDHENICVKSTWHHALNNITIMSCNIKTERQKYPSFVIGGWHKCHKCLLSEVHKCSFAYCRWRK